MPKTMGNTIDDGQHRRRWAIPTKSNTDAGCNDGQYQRRWAIPTKGTTTDVGQYLQPCPILLTMHNSEHDGQYRRRAILTMWLQRRAIPKTMGNTDEGQWVQVLPNANSIALCRYCPSSSVLPVVATIVFGIALRRYYPSSSVLPIVTTIAHRH